MLLIFIPVLMCTWIHAFFIVEICYLMEIMQFIYSLIDDYLTCFQFSTVLNETVMHVHVHICWDMFSFLRVNILLYLMKMYIQLEKKQIDIISVRKLRKMSLFLKITTMMIFSEKFKVTFVTIYVILQELFELRNPLEKNFQLISLKGPHSLVM